MPPKVLYTEEQREVYRKTGKYPNRTPAQWRLYRYGLTEEAYDALMEKQDGGCAICGAEGDFSVDHCHDTKKVRGLLCRECNIGLGKFKDDPELLRKAISYLISAVSCKDTHDIVKGTVTGESRGHTHRFSFIDQMVIEHVDGTGTS